jgi:hypothetical protein
MPKTHLVMTVFGDCSHGSTFHRQELLRSCIRSQTLTFAHDGASQLHLKISSQSVKL